MKEHKAIKKHRNYLFSLILLTFFLPSYASNASIDEQIRMLDMLDMMDALDQLEQMDFDDAANEAKTCIKSRNYSCATNKINSAKQFAYNDDTQLQVKNLYALLEQEKRQEQREIERERAERLAEERRRQEEQSSNQASAWATVLGSAVLTYGGYKAGYSGEQTANMVQSFSNDMASGDTSLSGLRSTVSDIQDEEDRKYQERQRQLRIQQEQLRAEEQRRNHAIAQEEQRKAAQAQNDSERQQRSAQAEQERKANEANRQRQEQERLAQEKATKEAKEAERQREKAEKEAQMAALKTKRQEEYRDYLTTKKNGIRLQGISCAGQAEITGNYPPNVKLPEGYYSDCIDVQYSVRCPNASNPYTRGTAYNYVGGASCYGNTYSITAPSCDIKSVIVKVERVTSCGGTSSSR